MTTALQRAFGEVDSMYARSKASVASIPGDLIGAGPMSDGINRADMSKAAEQLAHFRGWVYAAIRPIAQRIAGQTINVGRVSGAASVRSKAATKPDPLPTHPILDMLANPNGLLVGWSLMYSLVASLELTGRAFLWVTERHGQREAYGLAKRVTDPGGETFDVPRGEKFRKPKGWPDVQLIAGDKDEKKTAKGATQLFGRLGDMPLERYRKRDWVSEWPPE